MKNWKCIIGATILAPVCVFIFLVVVAAVVFLLNYIPFFLDYIIPSLVITFLLFSAWLLLYEHCKSKIKAASVNTPRKTKEEKIYINPSNHFREYGVTVKNINRD